MVTYGKMQVSRKAKMWIQLPMCRYVGIEKLSL